jgi:hypothetical protein
MKKKLSIVIASIFLSFSIVLFAHATASYYLGLDDTSNGYIKIAVPAGGCPTCLVASSNLSDLTLRLRLSSFLRTQTDKN